MRGIHVVLLVLGCGPGMSVPQDVDPTTSTSIDAVSSSGSTTPDANQTSSGEVDPAAPDWPPGFIGDPDESGPEIDCDVWAQNCRLGEKCVPWAHDGGVFWNATRCTPIAPDPGQPGDPCTIEGNGVSGVDTCDVGSMCWSVDPETETGTCTALCVGSENNPICVAPNRICSINAEGVLALCLPSCSPLQQDCAVNGEACYGVSDGFVCAPDVSGDGGGFGDPCEAINVCDPGLECINTDVVPGCAGAVGCCSPFCNHKEPGQCPAGLTCVPSFDPVEAPPGYEEVGICVAHE